MVCCVSQAFVRLRVVFLIPAASSHSAAAISIGRGRIISDSSPEATLSHPVDVRELAPRVCRSPPESPQVAVASTPVRSGSCLDGSALRRRNRPPSAGTRPRTGARSPGPPIPRAVCAPSPLGPNNNEGMPSAESSAASVQNATPAVCGSVPSTAVAARRVALTTSESSRVSSGDRSRPRRSTALNAGSSPSIWRSTCASSASTVSGVSPGTVRRSTDRTHCSG